MPLQLTDEEQRLIASDESEPGTAMAMRIVAEAGRLLGAERLIEIESAHIDGCLYHGDSAVHFAERLSGHGARVRVPTTCNVGALDLIHPQIVTADRHTRSMARRLMEAHVAVGCRPTWTCAPYQAGHRPSLGAQVAWGESNAICFVNSVLGARTNRYGDFLDLACAITGRAPYYGLHKQENRRARMVIDVSGLSRQIKTDPTFPAVLGALIGRVAGDSVAVVSGLDQQLTEDDLKALGAAAASSGAVGLFHIVGVTPEAVDLDAALQGHQPEETIVVSPDMMNGARESLGAAKTGEPIDCVALGSPHFSLAECQALADLSAGMRFQVPVYVCTGRHVYDRLSEAGLLEPLTGRGVQFVVDTCVVVTPILREIDGVLMTNSAKFAHYARPNTGYRPVFGSLADCAASAAAGKVVRDAGSWR